MVIEKLYLTDTFGVWAEKFNATIDASNTATANAEEAVKKAEEALQKAEQAVNDSVKGDDITIIVNEERQVVAKDVAIDGNPEDLASQRGQIGDTPRITETTIDLNDYVKSGAWWLLWDELLNGPEIDAGVNGLLVVYAAEGLEGTIVRQILYRWGIAGTTDKNMWTRSLTSNVTEWGPWYQINNSRYTMIEVDEQQNNTSVVGVPFNIRGKGVDGTSRAIRPFKFVPGDKTGNGLVIDTGGLVVIGGGESGRNVAAGLVGEGLSGANEILYLASDKGIMFLYNQNEGYDKNKCLSVYNNGAINLSAEHPTLGCTELSYDRLETLTENKTLFSHIVYDKNGARVAGLYNVKYTNGVTKYGILTYAHGITTNANSGIYSCIDKDDNKWGEAPTPPSASNTNHIATTEWVRNTALPKSGGTLTGAVVEKLAPLSGTSVALNLKTSNNFTHTATANTTFTVTANTGTSFQLGTLVLTNGGKYTITWPSSFKWADNTPPTLNSSGIDVITFFTVNGGTKYYAVQSITGVA